MKNTIIKIVAIVVAVAIVVTGAVLIFKNCKPEGIVPGGGITYPEYPNASADSDSWTQWDENDKITITWYVDLAGWNNNASSLISKEIYKKIVCVCVCEFSLVSLEKLGCFRDSRR